jgi:ABC-2 type transport system permease protein
VRAPSDAWTPRDDGLLIGLAMRLARRAGPPLALLGVDALAFREILRTRLRLDQRGAPSLRAGSTRAAGDGGFSMGAALILSLFWMAGLPIGLAAIALPAPAWMALVSGATLGLFFLQLALFYGAMLLDPTDIGVLQSRPVSGRTLFAARLAHVGVYLLVGCACFMFFPMTLGCIAHPAWAVLLLVPVTVLLSALLALGLVALMHALALLLVGPARFQRVALGLQMLMAMLIMGGLQPLMALGRHLGLVDSLQAHPALRALVPPLHFGSLFAVVLGRARPGDGALAAAAVLLPLAALVLALLVAGRHFVAGVSGAFAPQAARGARWPDGPLRRLGARLCRGPEEQAAFDFTLALARRDRAFLRQALPAALGLAVTGLGIVASLRLDPHIGAAVSCALPAAACFGALGSPALLEAARFSEHWPARWIFQALPVSDLRALLRGGVLALLLGWIAPLLLLSSLVLLLLGGVARAPGVLAGLLAATALALFPLPALQLRVPFTDQPRTNEVDFRNMGAVMLCTGLVFGTGALLGLITWLWAPGLLVASAIALLLAWRARRGLDRLQVVDTEG